jgi:hypothetical protein
MLRLCPISPAIANVFVAKYHRHHKPLKIHKFSIGCEREGTLVGVAIVARPASQHLDDGLTLDVARLCTDGTKNACSMLYSAAWRAAKSLGYSRIITYTLKSESGASLRAAGWVCAGEAGCFEWVSEREKHRKLLRELQRSLFGDDKKPPRETKIRYEKTSRKELLSQ